MKLKLYLITFKFLEQYKCQENRHVKKKLNAETILSKALKHFL